MYNVGRCTCVMDTNTDKIQCSIILQSFECMHNVPVENNTSPVGINLGSIVQLRPLISDKYAPGLVATSV